jgi:hypothetical protein
MEEKLCLKKKERKEELNFWRPKDGILESEPLSLGLQFQ